MTSETNMSVVVQWVEQIWNNANFNRLADFHPPSFQNEGRTATPKEMQEWHESNRVTFPDIHYSIDDIFATSDRVALRWSANATHKGSLWKMIPPTGKRISWSGIHLLRLEEAKIVEIWALQNNSIQLQQMGVTLQPPK